MFRVSTLTNRNEYIDTVTLNPLFNVAHPSFPHFHIGNTIIKLDEGCVTPFR